MIELAIDSLLNTKLFSEIYSLIIPYSSDTRPAVTFAYASILSSLAFLAPEIIARDNPNHIQFALNCIASEQHTLQEIGLSVLTALFGYPADVYIDFFEPLVRAITNCLYFQHIPLLEKALSCLQGLLRAVNIEGDWIRTVFDAICAVQRVFPMVLQPPVFDCFTALTVSAKEDSIRIADDLIRLLLQALELSTPETLLVKSHAIECFGVIVRFTEQSFELINLCLQRSIECLQTGDSELIASGLFAISEIARARHPQIATLLPAVIAALHIILSEEPTFEDDLDAEHTNVSISKLWMSALNLANTLAKYLPEVLGDSVTVLADDIYRLIDLNIVEDLEIAALRVAASLIRIIPDNRFFRAVFDGISESFDSGIVGQCFALFSPEFASEGELKAITELAMQAIVGELPCQSERESYDVEFGSQIYNFLRIVARAAPAVFPLERFVGVAQKVAARGGNFEIAEVVNVLAVCFEERGELLPGLYKKFIVKLFIEKLGICDFFTPPEPIAAVRVVVEKESKLIAGELEGIMNFLQGLLDAEYNGQLLFRQTRVWVVS
jgi:hypothetical protein